MRDLAWAAKPCLLEFAARRFYCGIGCAAFREELAWLPRYSRLRARYRPFVLARCRRTTLQALRQQEQLGYKRGERLDYAPAQEQAHACPSQTVSKLGIDEFALKKGHDQFALALSDLEAGRLLTVLPDRKKETREAHLATCTDQQRAAVEEVAMDLGNAQQLTLHFSPRMR